MFRKRGLRVCCSMSGRMLPPASIHRARQSFLISRISDGIDLRWLEICTRQDFALNVVGARLHWSRRALHRFRSVISIMLICFTRRRLIKISWIFNWSGMKQKIWRKLAVCDWKEQRCTIRHSREKSLLRFWLFSVSQLPIKGSIC